MTVNVLFNFYLSRLKKERLKRVYLSAISATKTENVTISEDAIFSDRTKIMKDKKELTEIGEQKKAEMKEY